MLSLFDTQDVFRGFILSNNDNFSYLLSFSFHPSFLGSYSSRMLTTTCNMMDRANIEKAIFLRLLSYRVFSVSDSKM